MNEQLQNNSPHVTAPPKPPDWGKLARVWRERTGERLSEEQILNRIYGRLPKVRRSDVANPTFDRMMRDNGDGAPKLGRKAEGFLEGHSRASTEERRAGGFGMTVSKHYRSCQRGEVATGRPKTLTKSETVGALPEVIAGIGHPCFTANWLDAKPLGVWFRLSGREQRLARMGRQYPDRIGRWVRRGGKADVYTVDRMLTALKEPLTTVPAELFIEDKQLALDEAA